MRAAARRAGVSPTAPCRRFPERETLVSAVAAEGYRELAAHLAAAHPSPTSPEEIAPVAVAYVRFALDHPALFRAMFAEPCDPDNEERVAATATIAAYVRDIARRTFPEADPEAPWTSVWALVHGLAFLHLDGTFDAATRSGRRAGPHRGPHPVHRRPGPRAADARGAAPVASGGRRRTSSATSTPWPAPPRDINSWTQGGTSERSHW